MSNGRLSHLEALREDVRDEAKRRMQQRDQYKLQLTVALGALVVGAFSTKGTHRLFIFAPLISIYFTVLILNSYGIHDTLARYLRLQIEPEFKALTGVPTEKEWETWYLTSGRCPEVRRWFFRVQAWIVTLISLSFLWYKESGTHDWFHTILICSTLIYLALVILISWLPRKHPEPLRTTVEEKETEEENSA